MTVGTVLPFDRLIRAMDDWASQRRELEVFAQIGSGAAVPKHMKWVRTMTPRAFDETARTASLIVAHAGIGTLIAAATAGRPIVILPRRQADREHTSDHQIDTARRLQGRPGIYVAMDETELPNRIEQALDQMTPPRQLLAEGAPSAFIERIRAFLDS